MPVQTINPPSLFPPTMYSQVAIATGTRTVFVAGQAPLNAAGRLVGEGDLAAQTEQAFGNVAAALAAAGAGFADVGRLTLYLVAYGESTLARLGEGFARAGDAIGGDVAPRPVTMIVASALGVPGQLIEIEATAILP